MYHISPEGLPELSIFMGHFDEYCHRLETWKAMEDYIKGLLMPVARKNCEQMAAAIPGCHAQRLHNLLITATRDEQAVNDKRLECFCSSMDVSRDISSSMTRAFRKKEADRSASPGNTRERSGKLATAK